MGLNPRALARKTTDERAIRTARRRRVNGSQSRQKRFVTVRYRTDNSQTENLNCDSTHFWRPTGRRELLSHTASVIREIPEVFRVFIILYCWRRSGWVTPMRPSDVFEVATVAKSGPPIAQLPDGRRYVALGGIGLDMEGFI